MLSHLGSRGAARTAVRFYGGKGKGGKGMDYGGKGGMGMKGGKGMMDMDPYAGKGGKGMDMYGKGGKGMMDMDPYAGKGGKGMDMYGGKGGKGMMDMDPYAGKGGKGMDMYGKGGKGMMDMDPYAGKGGKGMDMYGGKGGKGMMDMDPYAGKGGKGMGMKGGKGMAAMGMGAAGAAAAGGMPVPPAGGPPPAQLQLTFPYPAGQVPDLGMFDVSDEACRSMGFLHGQKLRVTNPQNPKEMFEMVAVGVAPDPISGDRNMWFHIAGEPGAGMFDVEMLNAYREYMEVVGKVKLNPLTATEQQQLKEHVQMARRMEMNEMNIECFESWRLSKSLQKRWQPAYEEPKAKDGKKTDLAALPWPPVCNFGYAMDTGDAEIPAVYAEYDKRECVTTLFRTKDDVKLQHGMTITVQEKNKDTKAVESKDYVVVGSRPMLGCRFMLWAHASGDAGARPLSLKKLKTAVLKNVPPAKVEERDEKDFQEHEPPVDADQFMAFERFIKRAERAVVRRIKSKKSKKGDAKDAAPAKAAAQ